MKKFLEKYSYFEERLLVFSLAVNVVLIFIQIIMRSIFNSSLEWSEELSRYIFIWQIWLGTSVAYNYHEHIKVDLINNIFKSDRSHKIIQFIVNIIWLAFNLFLLYEGFKLLQSMNARHALSSGMRLPLVYVYAALPVSSFLVSLRIIVDIYYELRNKNVEGQDKLRIEMEEEE